MTIKEILSQNRRDLYVDLICEHCGHIDKNVSGYDDDNFHKNVIPDMICGNCGEKASVDYRPFRPKYDKNEII